MKKLEHTEAFPTDWPFPASESFILRYTTDPQYREQTLLMLALFNCDEGTAYKFQTLPALAEWRYMATWFYQAKKEKGSFSRAPGIPSDEFYTWPNMFLHIGPRPSPKYSIHRLDDTRNYEVGNVAWATRKVQAIERRDKRKIKFKGRHLTYEQLESELLLHGVKKSVNAIKSFLKRNRPQFKTEAALHTYMFAKWGVINHEHIHDPGILKSSGFLPGYKDAAWWERQRETKGGVGMSRLDFQERHFRRILTDTSNKMKGFKPHVPDYLELQRLLDEVHRHYKEFLEAREVLKKQDAAAHIGEYSSINKSPSIGFPSGFNAPAQTNLHANG